MIDNTKNNSALLLGVGLDNQDEHRRITKGVRLSPRLDNILLKDWCKSL